MQRCSDCRMRRRGVEGTLNGDPLCGDCIPKCLSCTDPITDNELWVCNYRYNQYWHHKCNDRVTKCDNCMLMVGNAQQLCSDCNAICKHCNTAITDNLVMTVNGEKYHSNCVNTHKRVKYAAFRFKA